MRSQESNIIEKDRINLQNPYAHLSGEDGVSFDAKIGSKANYRPPEKLDSYSKLRLKDIAYSLQKFIWENKDEIWNGSPPQNAVQMLDPELALYLLGYKCEFKEVIPSQSANDDNYDIAGTIDQNNKVIQLSRRPDYITRRFTSAHELGHALLHRQATMHRDKPLDGTQKGIRDSFEREADIFASYFLMPDNLVTTRFEQIFGRHESAFELNEATEFALKAYSSRLKNIKTRRDLSRLLAQLETYNGLYFESLSKQFGVSVEAMAIRLEELGLV